MFTDSDVTKTYHYLPFEVTLKRRCPIWPGGSHETVQALPPALPRARAVLAI